MADKVIERNLLAAADRARGRFRGFLAASLEHYAANQFRDERAGKRAPGGGAKLLSLDPELGIDPAASIVA